MVLDFSQVLLDPQCEHCECLNVYVYSRLRASPLCAANDDTGHDRELVRDIYCQLHFLP